MKIDTTQTCIYVYDKDNGPQPMKKYRSDIVPRAGECLYFSHFGTYEVVDVLYYVSDDRVDGDELMWVEVYVSPKSS